VIVSATRTPIGRARKGSLADVDAVTLAEIVLREALVRSRVPHDAVDEVVLAEGLQGGGVIGRNAAVRIGLPSLPGVAVNRHCAAGLAAVQIAAAGIRAGVESAVLAGGTSSASTAPRQLLVRPGADPEPWMPESHPDSPEAPAFDMSVCVGENAARIGGLTREEADAWAARSHQRACEAIAKEYFVEEIVPVPLPGGGLFTTDEHPRPGTTPEKLAALAVLHPELPGATVTAGNASGINDAAAALMLTSDEFAAAHGLTARARIRSWANVGIEPARTALAPTIAIPRALQRAGITLSDLDVVEINEAFAVQALLCTRELALDEEIVNVNGSGCSLGHPVAATGARMLVSMIHELERRDAQLGCVAMCAGGGMGAALVVERI
jgi:acetyl-CoA C-acetyltransferase